MGQELSKSDFEQDAEDRYRVQLRRETGILKSWFDDRAFDQTDQFTTGLELEAWLLDRDHLPTPRNEEFLAAANDPDIVSELSKFNFELNAPPRPLDAQCFHDTETALLANWAKVERAAHLLDIKPCMAGIVPTVRDDMLQTKWMSNTNRYKALNTEVMRRRRGQDLHIDIKRDDHLRYHCEHIMLEGACTSLQAHLKINQDDAVRFYNAALAVAGPLVAATANSPFLYGKSLWAETRIPAFEQATALENFRDKHGRNVRRVTLGTGYIRNSLLELFLDNLSYPVLLPELKQPSHKLPYVQLQNGTVWRWIRPILGFDGSGQPHLRIEHRVMPSGPTLADTVANLALCHGMIFALARADTAPEDVMPFEDIEANFYACAKEGLRAKVRWMGKETGVQSLLVDQLIPAARSALEREGVSNDDLDYCFQHIMGPRVRSGRTGTNWQRSFVNVNGPNFQALTEAYVAQQKSGSPVHLWDA